MNDMEIPTRGFADVYDILNCGPRNRFVANGKLVHNSGMDRVNLQNLSSRSGNAGALKRAILPPEGYLWISSDSSQIEARVLAWLAEQDDLVQAFYEGRDVYSETASSIYGRPIDRKRVELDADGKEFHPDKVEGMVGKTAVLSGGYGAGAKSFQNMLRIQGGLEFSEQEAKRAIDAYRARYSMIPLLWKKADQIIPNLYSGNETSFGRDGIIKVSKGRLTMPNGVSLMYPQLHQETDERGYRQWVFMQGRKPVNIYGGKLVENCTQNLARAIIAYQMLLIAKKYRVVLTVHDSVEVVVPEHEAHQAKEFVEECMKQVPDWAQGLPITCEAGIGESYGECQ